MTTTPETPEQIVAEAFTAAREPEYKIPEPQDHEDAVIAVAALQAHGLLAGAPTEEQLLDIFETHYLVPRDDPEFDLRALLNGLVAVASAAGVATRPAPTEERPYSEDIDHEYGAWETNDIEEHAHDMLAVVQHRRAAAGVAPQEPEWEHGVIGGHDLLSRLMDTLAYYHCRSVNPKADSPYQGYHAMSEDQREFLRERQREAAEEVLRMWRAEASPAPSPDREELIAKARVEAERYKRGLRAMCNGAEFDPADLKRRAFVQGVEWAATSLAAPVEVDEAKLAEVINAALAEWEGEEPSEVFVAWFIKHRLAEWLRGGRQPPCNKMNFPCARVVPERKEKQG
ncbi:hypothetical protein MUN78_04500 [Leucobacter allii]|uniref:Uncharacterized protein n=1 Tax=Leucobacter allii TaxID=2932247 RepID=A0ABY4FPA3_9MICO|nr:hypothetical protein [Leucobacter allii]UOQ58112.1 hypothetical protein MUN78_04500 [Leucobacter allii]